MVLGPLSGQMLEQEALGPFNIMMSDLMGVEGVSRSPSAPLDDGGIDAIDCLVRMHMQGRRQSH